MELGQHPVQGSIGKAAIGIAPADIGMTAWKRLLQDAIASCPEGRAEQVPRLVGGKEVVYAASHVTLK